MDDFLDCPGGVWDESPADELEVLAEALTEALAEACADAAADAWSDAWADAWSESGPLPLLE